MVILAMPFFIAPYRHVKPLDRQTYHRHHRQAHSANGERIADFSEQYEHGKTEHHRQQQASDNKALAKSEQQNEHLTAYGSLQKPNTQQQTKPHYMGHWWEPNSKPNTQAER